MLLDWSVSVREIQVRLGYEILSLSKIISCNFMLGQVKAV
jgi:hypothetical protein